MFICKKLNKGQVSDTQSGSLLDPIRMRRRIRLKISKKKSSEANFRRASSSHGRRGRPCTGVQSCAPVVHLLEMCLSVSSFHFTTPKLRPADLLMRIGALRCACAASIEHVFVFTEVLLGWSGVPACLTGSLREPLLELV